MRTGYQYLQYLIIICASMLLFIWGLPHTIALRNAVVSLGAIGALIFLFKNKPFILSLNTTPLILIYCLPFWVLTHFYFFSENPALELIEIKSLWLRVVAGMLIATAMGVLIRKPNYLNTLFTFSFFGMSIAVVVIYVVSAWKLDRLVAPIDFTNAFLFDRNKVGSAFFSAVAIAVGCATATHFFLKKEVKIKRINFFIILVLIGVGTIAPLVANSKNGVTVSLLLLLSFFGATTVHLLRNENSRMLRWKICLPISILCLMAIVVVMHKSSAAPGWRNLFSDIQTSLDIDSYQAWRGPKASFEESYPKNSLGVTVTPNTYERFSWIRAG